MSLILRPSTPQVRFSLVYQFYVCVNHTVSSGAMELGSFWHLEVSFRLRCEMIFTKSLVCLWIYRHLVTQTRLLISKQVWRVNRIRLVVTHGSKTTVIIVTTTVSVKCAILIMSRALAQKVLFLTRVVNKIQES